MLNELAKEIHKDNVAAGWWPKDVTPEVLGTKLCLIHSEVSECMEGVRKGIPDDKLPHRSMEEVEMGDAIIRILDYAGARGLDLDGAIAEKRAYNAQRADHKIENRLAAGGKSF